MHVADAKAFLRSADRYLVEGDELEFGEFAVRVIHTPGHSPGSLCYQVVNHLFTGDTLLAGGIGRERPGSDVRLQLVWIGTKLARLPLTTAPYPGQGPVTKLATDLSTGTMSHPVRRSPPSPGRAQRSALMSVARRTNRTKSPAVAPITPRFHPARRTRT